MDEITIGKIRTSHGVKGFLKVMSFSGQTEHFFKLKKFVLKKNGKTKVLDVEKIRSSGSTLFVKLKGIDTPEVGKTYAGWEIEVARELASPLDHEEYYIKDLNGCEIVNSGKVLGHIIGISENRVNDLLEVKTESGVFIIPFKEEFIGDIDIASHKVELKVIWLLQ